MFNENTFTSWKRENYFEDSELLYFTQNMCEITA